MRQYRAHASITVRLWRLLPNTMRIEVAYEMETLSWIHTVGFMTSAQTYFHVLTHDGTSYELTRAVEGANDNKCIKRSL